MIRRIRVPCCDICGIRLGDKYLVCPECRRKVDSDCSVRIEHRRMCTVCLRTYLPLSKRAFLVIGCIANGISDRGTIHRLTKIDKGQVRDLLEQLAVFGMLEKKGVSVFSSFHITDSGMLAIGALRPIFGRDADTRHFSAVLQDFLKQASVSKVK